MTDVPVPVKATGAAGQQKQLIMLAVLGGVLVLILVFFVLKPFGGSDSGSVTPSPTVSTPATSVPVSPSSGEGEGESSAEEPEAIERPARNPFGQP